MPVISTQFGELGELSVAASCSVMVHTHWVIVAAASVVVDTGIVAKVIFVVLFGVLFVFALEQKVGVHSLEKSGEQAKGIVID